MSLESIGLRVGERFCWSYDFTAGWVIDLRVEALLDVDSPQIVSGRRAGPPEWVGGTHGFLAWEDSHSIVDIVDLITAVFDEPGDDDEMSAVDLMSLREWLGRDRFDRAEVNLELSALYERWSKLEVPSCESLSKSASTTTTMSQTVTVS